jgi:hypothetical protein
MSGDGVEYSASLIIEPDSQDVPVLKKNIDQVLIEKFGEKALPQKGRSIRNPLRDADAEGKDDSAYAGKLFMTARSRRAPQIVDKQLFPVTSDSEAYSGVYANVSVSLFAYDVSGSKGVGCGLNNIQVLGYGERLGGAGSAEDDFETIED